MTLLPKPNKSYGGSLRTNRRGRVGARPLSAKQSIHLVLRSERATGKHSLNKRHAVVKAIIFKQARLAGVSVQRWANAGNHLHLQIKLSKGPQFRSDYNRFIRAISGLIARLILNAERSRKRVQEHAQRFWSQRPWTRVLSSFKESRILANYIYINQFEQLGFSRNQVRDLLAANEFMAELNST